MAQSTDPEYPIGHAGGHAQDGHGHRHGHTACEDAQVSRRGGLVGLRVGVVGGSRTIQFCFVGRRSEEEEGGGLKAMIVLLCAGVR